MQTWQQEVKDIDVRIKHGTRVDGVRYTVAIALDNEAELVSYGIATTSLKDNFNRKIGRSIAAGRAKKRMAQMDSYTSDELPDNVLYNLAEYDEAAWRWAKRELLRVHWIDK